MYSGEKLIDDSNIGLVWVEAIAVTPDPQRWETLNYGLGGDMRAWF